MLLKSIRFRIIIWYMLIMGLTLLIFSIFVYNTFRVGLYDDMDDLLESKAQGIASSINTYWEAQKLESISKGEKAPVFDKIDIVNFTKISQRWVKDKTEDSKLSDVIIQIFGVDGKEIASSENVPDISILPEDVFEDVSEGEESYDNFSIKRKKGKVVSIRAYTMPVLENNKVSYIVQVATPLDQINLALDKLRIPFLIFLPLTVLFTGAGGLFLVSLAFKPVNTMIDTIRQITASNLKLRVNIPDSKDEIRRLADTFNDMLVKLDQAISSERQFVQDISHELKTPLTILKGELEVTLKRMRTAEEYDYILRSSLEEINRISRIVDNLLMLARFDNKEIHLDIKRFDLNALAESVVEDISVLAEQKDIDLRFNGMKELFIDADEGHIRRLLLNLVDNAIKYTPANKMTALSLDKSEKFAIIKITDTGSGIPQEELPYIFDRFYRSQKAGTNTGFGLGLAIAHSIVSLHRGKIEVSSVFGSGSEFRVFLPLPGP
ncbi:MAG: HAMP domain-containing protein [Candidatus Omnitrophica bacterium]|nr:HAMP domain-containing protein [Candidatus Omnitrophota bacterium]